MSTKTRVWLSYDLGVSGDYENLYSWLDKNEALECGDSIATFLWEGDNNIKENIKNSLESVIDFNKNDRIYLIYKNKEKGNSFGSFIVGKRKSNPWKGYSSEPTMDDE
jgi:hypothetical protein